MVSPLMGEDIVFNHQNL